jgi:phosphatidylglycerophosphatase A
MELDLSNHTSSLFVLYLILSSNFLAPLFSCKIQNFIQSSMLLRHILGYMTMTFFVLVANQKNPLPIGTLIALSIGLYTWFVASTRMNLYAWFILLIAIGGCYLLQIYQDDIERDTENLDERQDELTGVNLAKKILTGIAIAITIFGVAIYFGEKRVEYGKKFNLSTFVLGVPECRRYTPDIGIGKSLKTAIGLK